MAAQPVITQAMIEECMDQLCPDDEDRDDPMARMNALVTHIMRGAGVSKRSDPDTKKDAP